MARSNDNSGWRARRRRKQGLRRSAPRVLAALACLAGAPQAGADVPCIRDRNVPDAPCLSEEDYHRFTTRLGEHYKQENFAEIHRMLNSMDLGNDTALLQSRATLYFWQNGTTITACDAVRDLEKVVPHHPVSTGGLLDLIYQGAWKQIAAREGSPAARLLLVEKLRDTRKRGFDTLFKFSQRLYYGELLSLLHEDGMATASDDLRARAAGLRQDILTEIAENDVDLADLRIAEIKPVGIICPPRY